MDNYQSRIWRPLLKPLLVLLTLASKVLGLSPDGQALMNFRQTVTSSDGVLLQWRPEDPDPCGWRGVLCDPKTKRVTSLDLSSNSLSGPIPLSLRKLDKLKVLNVSTNFLSGQIPSEGKLATFPNNSFLGNHRLCGEQLGVLCKNGDGSTFSPPNSAQNSKKRYSGRLLISASATIGALLLVALMCFWGCFLYKRLGKNDVQSLAADVSGGASIVMFHGDLPYSSKDIIKKLETLNEEHIIGSGGFGTVYCNGDIE